VWKERTARKIQPPPDHRGSVRVKHDRLSAGKLLRLRLKGSAKGRPKAITLDLRGKENDCPNRKANLKDPLLATINTATKKRFLLLRWPRKLNRTQTHHHKKRIKISGRFASAEKFVNLKGPEKYRCVSTRTIRKPRHFGGKGRDRCIPVKKKKITNLKSSPSSEERSRPT